MFSLERWPDWGFALVLMFYEETMMDKLNIRQKQRELTTKQKPTINLQLEHSAVVITPTCYVISPN